MLLIFRSVAVYNIAICLFLLPIIENPVHAGGPVVTFDVPAMLPVRELIPVGVPPVTHWKIIEVVLPVTADIRAGDRENLSEFRFEVSWNAHSFPVADYGPKSQTVSHIDGSINVDTSEESSAGIGLNGRSAQLEIASLTGDVDLLKRSTARKTYQEIPQHRPVIASGTINRGTGTFFRFHQSRTETLEGGREIVVAFRVSREWQGGVLKVACRALGQRKILGTFPDKIDVSKSFVMPIYLEGDVNAQQRAKSFVVAAQELRRHWHHRTQSQSNTETDKRFAGFDVFAPIFHKNDWIAQQWVHHLIQSGDAHLTEVLKKQLPETTVRVADEFIAARKSLLKLSR